MLRRDPCVAADPNGPAATLHGGARRRHVASCRVAQANHLPRAQLERSAAAPRARLRDRWAVERGGAAARQRLGAHPSPTGPAGTASSSHFRLDQTVVGGSGRSGAAGRDQHGARQPLARATAREPATPCARPRRSRGAEPTASALATALRAVGLPSAG